METATKKYPAGTTNEQWEQYESDYEVFMGRISVRKFELDRMLNYLKFINPEKNTWTLDEIRRKISDEISKSESMDAPNKPGYYRANND